MTKLNNLRNGILAVAATVFISFSAVAQSPTGNNVSAVQREKEAAAHQSKVAQLEKEAQEKAAYSALSEKERADLYEKKKIAEVSKLMVAENSKQIAELNAVHAELKSLLDAAVASKASEAELSSLREKMAVYERKIAILSSPTGATK
jgi:hypothetical protein